MDRRDKNSVITGKTPSRTRWADMISCLRGNRSWIVMAAGTAHHRSLNDALGYTSLWE